MRHQITIKYISYLPDNENQGFLESQHETAYTCAASFEPFRGSLQFDGVSQNWIRVVTHRFKIRTPVNMDVLSAQSKIYYNGKVFEIIEHEPTDHLDEFRLISARLVGNQSDKSVL